MRFEPHHAQFVDYEFTWQGFTQQPVRYVTVGQADQPRAEQLAQFSGDAGDVVHPRLVVLAHAERSVGRIGQDW